MRTLVAVVLMAAAAVAQQQDPNRIAEFQANRLKDRLKLSDDQTSKLKEIFLKEAEDRAKSDEARTAKINELLDDEQKKLYEEYRRNRGGGFGGGGQQFQFGGGRGGQFGQQGLVQMDDLKRELTLTDEQIEKIKPLVDEFNAPLQKRMEEFRGGTFNWQNFDWQGELSKYGDNLKALNEKIKAHLTDDQKSKADALYERNTSWMRLIPGFVNRATGESPRRQSPEERVRRAMDALRIEKEEERAAIKNLVEKIAKAQAEFEDWQKAARDRLGETTKNKELSDAALEDRIKENQEERRKREKDIATLQKQLAEAVNNRQEIELMLQGILK
jgi:hypothetical protein